MDVCNAKRAAAGQFRAGDGAAFVFDAGSAHGTFLNKRRVKPRVHAPLRRAPCACVMISGCCSTSHAQVQSRTPRESPGSRADAKGLWATALKAPCKNVCTQLFYTISCGGSMFDHAQLAHVCPASALSMLSPWQQRQAPSLHQPRGCGQAAGSERAPA